MGLELRVFYNLGIQSCEYKDWSSIYIVLLKYGPAMLFGLLSYKFFFRFEMVNASCDFCNNNYRTNPHIGYFKVTASLKTSLRLQEGAGLNTI